MKNTNCRSEKSLLVNGTISLIILAIFNMWVYLHNAEKNKHLDFESFLEKILILIFIFIFALCIKGFLSSKEVMKKYIYLSISLAVAARITTYLMHRYVLIFNSLEIIFLLIAYALNIFYYFKGNYWKAIADKELSRCSTIIIIFLLGIPIYLVLLFYIFVMLFK